MRMRRILSALLVGVMGMAILAGCGQKEDENSVIAIELETYYNGSAKIALDKLVAEFNKTVGKEKNIYVKSESKGDMNELFEKLQAELEKPEEEREFPDIFCCYGNDAIQYDAEGLLVDLDDYFTEEELDEYVDAYIEEGRVGNDGELLIFPIAKSVEVLTINKTDWDKFAADTGADLVSFETWEGVTKTAEEYYNWSDGKALFGRDAFANYMLVGAYQLGEDIFLVEDGKASVNLDKDIMKKLWDNYYIPYVKGYFASNGRYRSDDMKTGDLIAAIGSSSAGAYYAEEVTVGNQEPYEIEVIELPVPNFEGTEKAVVKQGAGYVVTKSTEQREAAAVEFIKWFTQVEENCEFCLASSYLPVKKEANDIAYMEEAAKNGEGEWTDLARGTTEVAMEECNTYELYTMTAFENSTKARSIVETSMNDKAKADREKVQNNEISVEELEENANFETWYEDVKSQLEEAVQ